EPRLQVDERGGHQHRRARLAMHGHEVHEVRVTRAVSLEGNSGQRPGLLRSDAEIDAHVPVQLSAAPHLKEAALAGEVDPDLPPASAGTSAWSPRRRTSEHATRIGQALA